MSGADAESASREAADHKAMLRALGDSVERHRKASDLAGLAQVQELASRLAEAQEGRTRKQAERLAHKAQSASDALRRAGVETAEQRRGREARLAEEAQRLERESSKRLADRIASLLELLLNDGRAPSDAVAALQPLTEDVAGGRPPAVPEGPMIRSGLLLDGYERSRMLFAAVDAGAVTGRRLEITRRLKAVAVELMTAGAEVRGLTTDAVPLIAYAISTGNVPVLLEVDSPAAAERINDLLLRIADEAAAMPAEVRSRVIGLYRLAILLGESQSYADKLALTRLEIS